MSSEGQTKRVEVAIATMARDVVSETFFSACVSGDLELLQQILPRLDNLEISNDKGWTGLIMAVFNDHCKAAELLLSAGADVNAHNAKGTTVFMYAKTPASRTNDFALLSVLLEYGADINARDCHDLTALDYVQRQGNSLLLGFLKDRGAVHGEARALSNDGDVNMAR